MRSGNLKVGRVLWYERKPLSERKGRRRGFRTLKKQRQDRIEALLRQRKRLPVKKPVGTEANL